MEQAASKPLNPSAHDIRRIRRALTAGTRTLHAVFPVQCVGWAEALSLTSRICNRRFAPKPTGGFRLSNAEPTIRGFSAWRLNPPYELSTQALDVVAHALEAHADAIHHFTPASD
jgi:hypothetical protein